MAAFGHYSEETQKVECLTSSFQTNIDNDNQGGITGFSVYITDCP